MHNAVFSTVCGEREGGAANEWLPGLEVNENDFIVLVSKRPPRYPIAKRRQTCRRTENTLHAKKQKKKRKKRRRKKVDKVGHRYKGLTGLKVANV